ncbi:MAG: LemA family protein [Bacteroidales bacterium]|nr:LemA family protein [Bacteroidales bacterium]
MKKSTTWIIAVVAILCLYGGCSYNGFVSAEENVNKAWADVQADYQRRYDLIPNIVNTVKGYADTESKILTDVVEARNKATQMTLSVDSLGKVDEAYMENFRKVQAELSGSLSRLMAITEAYPDLKSNEQFMKLQDQLEGTENRIKESRKSYNAAVQDYNLTIRSFPKNILAGMFGFNVKPSFSADEGAEKRVDVQF